jgi:hypothetical protein
MPQGILVLSGSTQGQEVLGCFRDGLAEKLQLVEMSFLFSSRRRTNLEVAEGSLEGD